jgi:hypothetical protein
MFLPNINMMKISPGQLKAWTLAYLFFAGLSAYGYGPSNTVVDARPSTHLGEARAECIRRYHDTNARAIRECPWVQPSELNPDANAAARFEACKRQKGFVPENEITNACASASGSNPPSTFAAFGGRSSETETVYDKPATNKKSAPLPPSRPANLGQSGTSPQKGRSKTTPNPATTADSGTATESSADRGTCVTLLQTAQSCCMNPSSCLTLSERSELNQIQNSMNSVDSSLSTQQGLRDRCMQTNALGDNSIRINSLYSQACIRPQTECIARCRSHSDIISNCNALSTQAASFGNQASLGSSAGAAGNNCDSLTNASPQNMGGLGNGSDPDLYNQANLNNPNDPYGCQSNPNSPACIQCANDPTNPMCKGLTENKMAEGQAGFGGPEVGRSPSDFNVGNLSDAGGFNDGFTGAGLQAASVTTGPTKTIPNNSGGSLPGDGGTTSAKLEAPSRGGGGAGRRTVNTDIEQGFRSGGGGYAYASGTNTAESGGDAQGSSRPSGRSPANDDGGLTGLDLREYLPGGALAAHRRTGGVQPSSREINGPGVDIFERISWRMQEKCRLGYLLGCN